MCSLRSLLGCLRRFLLTPCGRWAKLHGSGFNKVVVFFNSILSFFRVFKFEFLSVPPFDCVAPFLRHLLNKKHSFVDSSTTSLNCVFFGLVFIIRYWFEFLLAELLLICGMGKAVSLQSFALFCSSLSVGRASLRSRSSRHTLSPCVRVVLVPAGLKCGAPLRFAFLLVPTVTPLPVLWRPLCPVGFGSFLRFASGSKNFGLPMVEVLFVPSWLRQSGCFVSSVPPSPPAPSPLVFTAVAAVVWVEWFRRFLGFL